MYNILYGNRMTTTENNVRELVELLGVDSSLLDQPAGKNGSSLSGGQRQLVWCLRLFFKDPEIILMDEPTASLDTDTKDMVMRLLHMLMKSKTVILVTHDPYLLEHVDAVVRVVFA
jgi:ABC-type bacteriocin/lantibiotic exporter with double-glycine peptidase domain